MDSLAAASVDLTDGFHQFGNAHLASWFTLAVEGLTAEETGVREVYDGSLGRMVGVEPWEPVWAAYAGMPMGWSWALWVCHETLTSVLQAAALPGDELVQDRALAPTVGPDVCAYAPYVDNIWIRRSSPTGYSAC